MQLPQNIIQAAQTAQRKWGVPAAVSLAQFGVESAWGKHMPEGSNNPFGIKAMHGHPYVMAMTSEFLHGRYIRCEQPFRKFTDFAEAFDAHAELLATSPYYAHALVYKGDPEKYAAAIAHPYATDPHYAAKLIAIMRSAHLEQYDAAA